MDNSFSLVGKRALTIVVAAATMLWSIGLSAFLPLTAQAYTAGQLIKGTTLSTVYYYASNGERYAFPNEKTYFTWYSDFSGVTTITDSELAAIPLAGNIVYRYGVRWVKITSDAKTYAVGPQGQLYWIEDEATATNLAGSDWNTMIDDVPDVFFVDYTVGASLTDAGDAFNGALVSMGGSTYLVWNGEKRLVTDAGFSANRFQTRSELDGSGIDLAGLTSGSDVSGAESALTDTAQLGDEVTGGLSVSLASDTPAQATVPAGAASVPFSKFKLTASSGSASIDQLIVHLGGVGSVSNIDNVYLYEGDTRITDGRSVNSSTRDVTFSGLDIDLTSGESDYLTVRADIADEFTVNGGDTANFSLASASSVVGTATVSGTFPVTGNTMTFSTTPAGTITVDKTGSISSPTLGEEDATIGKFTVEANDEDASLEQITVNVDSASDHDNFQLWNGSDLLSTGSVSGDLVTFVLTQPLDITEGDMETLEVSADIGGDSGDEVKVAVEEEADVIAIGGDFGFNMAADISGYDSTGSACADSTDDCSFSEIQGGKLTFAFNGPSADDIQVDGNDEVLMEFALTAENWVEVKNIGVVISSDDVSTFGGLTDGTDAALEDISIRKDDGSVWMGPQELDASGSSTDQNLDFDDSQTMNAGESLDLMITADVANDEDLDGEVFHATLDLDASSTDGVQAEDINGDDLATDDIVPSGDIVGHDFTVTTASLDVDFSTPPSDATYVKGASNVTVAGVNFGAGSTSDMTITDVTFSANMDGDGDESLADVDAGDVGDHVSSCSIYDNESGSLIDGPEGLSTTDQILFENFDWTVSAGETGKMLLKCNFSNTDVLDADTVNDLYNFDITAASDITAEDEDGDEVDASIGTDNAAGGVTTITIVAAGSLTLSLDGSSADSTIILGASTGVDVGTWKFSATDEPFLLDTLTLYNNGTDDVASSVKLTCEDEAGATVTKTGFLSGGEVTYDNLDCYIPTDVTKTITASIDTNSVSSTGAVSGDTFQLGLDADTDFEAVGQSSGETVTDAGTDTDAHEMIIHKTKPTISLASGSPSGAGVPGFSEAFRFNVSADSRGFVTLDDVLFKVTTTANAAAWNVCGTFDDATLFELYDAADPSTKLDDDGDWTFYEADGGACAAAAVGFAELDFEGDSTTGPEEIGAGTTKTYVLKIDTTGASSDPSDSIRIDIPDEGEADGVALNAIRWDDDVEGDDFDGTYVKDLPVTGGTIIY